MKHSDLEDRLTDALHAAADDVTPSAPPSFSWQAAPGRRLRPRTIAVGGSALVAAAVAAAVAASTLTGGASSGPSPALAGPTSSVPVSRDAHTLLLTAARSKLHAASPPLADGQFRYVRTTSAAPETITPDGTIEPPADAYTLDELWIPKDQTDVWLRRQRTVGDPGDHGVSEWKGRCDDLYADTQDGPKGDACTRPGTFDDATPAFIAALPRDADALYTQLREYAAGRLNPDKIHDIDFTVFETVQGLLVAGLVTDDLTSTLYSVLAKIPGIRVTAGTTNAAGVPGTGFTLSTYLGHDRSYPETETIIVDTATGAYLGERDSTPDNHYADAVSVGVADRIGVAGH